MTENSKAIKYLLYCSLLIRLIAIIIITIKIVNIVTVSKNLIWLVVILLIVNFIITIRSSNRYGASITMVSAFWMLPSLDEFIINNITGSILVIGSIIFSMFVDFLRRKHYDLLLD